MRVVVTRRCAAPPEAIWPWLSDPEKHVQMLPHTVQHARVLENGDVSCTISALGVSEPMVVRVVERQEPTRLVEERVDGKRAGKSVFDVAPDGDGSTVTLTSDVDLPMLLAGIAKRPVEQSLTQQLENLDRLSSGNQPG
jgi:carbon monoxide dehydrogenase subunit G